MKISPTENANFKNTLLDANPGECIEFKSVPHQHKHAPSSIFMVLRIPSRYIETSERKPHDVFRIMVANLETGYCSLVAQDRAIRFVDAEVTKL